MEIVLGTAVTSVILILLLGHNKLKMLFRTAKKNVNKKIDSKMPVEVVEYRINNLQDSLIELKIKINTLKTKIAVNKKKKRTYIETNAAPDELRVLQFDNLIKANESALKKLNSIKDKIEAQLNQSETDLENIKFKASYSKSLKELVNYMEEIRDFKTDDSDVTGISSSLDEDIIRLETKLEMIK